jgi:hypothetical protein
VSGHCAGAANIRCCPTGVALEITTVSRCTVSTVRVCAWRMCLYLFSPFIDNQYVHCSHRLASHNTAPPPLSSSSPYAQTHAHAHIRTHTHARLCTSYPSQYVSCLNGKAGNCIDINKETCDGTSVLSGFCAGASNIKCCPVPGTPSGVTAPTTEPDPTSSEYASCLIGKAGSCINVNTETCEGASTITNFCSGASNIKCCPVPGTPSGATPEPTDEPAPTTSVCTSGKEGVCLDEDTHECSGGETVSGHCDGAANIKCCPTGVAVAVASTSTPPAPSPTTSACTSGKEGVCLNENTHQCDGTVRIFR